MASAGKGSVISDWAELLPELLTLIAKWINSYEDFLAYGGVCRSWRSVAVKKNFNHSASSSPRVQIPWLMLAAEEGGGSEIRAFASLAKGGMVHRVDLPEARGKHCIGSMGWLITTDEKGNTELLHPLSRVRIPLPRPTAYRNHWQYDDEIEMNPGKLLVKRAVLSASPSMTDDYVLMVIVGKYFYAAFWRPGNNAWTVVGEPHPFDCLDVIYYNDQFYAIHKRYSKGILFLFDPNSGSAQTVGHVSPDATDPKGGDTYLVESPSGDLLVVSRIRYIYDGRDHNEYWTTWFRIYKFDSGDMTKCQEINDLGGASIFVGHSAATSVPAATVAVNKIKPNCIYFTDDYVKEYSIARNLIGGKDMGVYSLETRTTEPLPKVSTTPFINYCPLVWVSPSF